MFPGLRSIDGHNLVNPLELSIEEPFYLTFLRDPISRVISHYQSLVLKGKTNKTFEESLRTNEKLENLHVKLMAGERNLDKAKYFLSKCGFVGLTEKFDLSLCLLERLSPYKLNLNYIRLNDARDKTIEKSLQADGHMMELAKEYNKLDIELYDFAVKEVFPELCAKVGISPYDPVKPFNNYKSRIKPKYVLGRWYNKIYRQINKMR
jgi:hypothetical protein